MTVGGYLPPVLERAILVRSMLLALLASACAGVALVFLPNVPGTGKLAATAGIVVAACALLLFQGSRGEGDRLTMAQRAWVVYVTVPAMAAIGLVWFTPTSDAVGRQIVLAIGTWVVYGLVSFLVSLPGLRGRSADGTMRLNPLARRILVACAALGFAIGMIGHQVGSVDKAAHAYFVMWLYGILVVHAGLAAAAAIALPSEGPGGARTRADRITGGLGLAVSAASLAAWIVVLGQAFGGALSATGGGIGQPDESLVAVAVGLASAAVTVALWTPMHVMRLSGSAWAAHVLATALTGMLGALATAAVQGWAVQVVGDELFGRVVFALVILDACTLIGVAVTVRMSRRGRGSAAFLRPVESVRVRCPRCLAGAQLRPGENACASCGLVMVIGFRDDRCPACEYDLRAVAAGSACPECGRARQTA
jgi:hypothetical protein